MTSSGAKVLVVEDDRDLGDVLQETITWLGHEVVVASNGTDALGLAEGFAPDLALVDVFLPDINGITLAGLLRGVVGGKPLRVLGLSAYGTARMEAASTRGIFDGHLAKPLTVGDIRALFGS